MKTKINSVIIFLVYAAFSAAQINIKFVHHLTVNNLVTEHKAYLNSFPAEKDSTLYLKAKFNLKENNDSLFLNFYRGGEALCQSDTQLIKDANIYFLRKNNNTTRQWYNLNQKYSAQHFTTTFRASVNPNLYTPDSFPAELRKPFAHYNRAYNKKPWIAASFSALLPGLGKLYAGKNKTFLLAFILNAGYALQTIESTNKLGLKHPLSIINLGAFTVFYLSNIYGSYHAVLDLRKEQKKQFLTDAANFYN